MASLQVEKTIKQLGRNIQLARRRRRMSIQDFAVRVGTSEATIMRLEKGEPGVRIEVFVSALSILGKLPELRRLLDPSDDDQGLMIDISKLPQRLRTARRTLLPRRGGETNDEGVGF